MLHRSLHATAALLIGLVQLPEPASAQTVTCASKDFRPSLVRIERQSPYKPGTGVTIVRHDKYAIVLTAKHVLEGVQDFSVFFRVAPDLRVSVRWTDRTVFGFPAELDLVVFRVDAVPGSVIPAEVIPEDPFSGDFSRMSKGATVVSWGYPTSSPDGTLCSHEAKLLSNEPGQLIADGYVETGVSGGPMFFIDPEDGAPKLVGIVARGDGMPTSGTTHAIDIRLAVPIVTRSADPANRGRPHIWPNIPLPREIVVDALSRSFVKVDAGTFVMGSNNVDDEKWPDGDGGKSAQKTLSLPAFYMGKFEVTVAQYRECVAAGACTHTGRNMSSNEPNFPVVGVTWQEAKTYAEWLRSRLSRPETPRELRRLLEAGWQTDLPSEEEWEKAARRGGRETYPWGNNPNPRKANYNTGQLRPVGSSNCSDCEYSLEDMAGNAREWTRSLKLPYPYIAAKAEDPTAAGKRAVRGGSAVKVETAPFAVRIVRAANRQEEDPAKFDQYTGFRVALICRKDRGCNWQDPD